MTISLVNAIYIANNGNQFAKASYAYITFSFWVHAYYVSKLKKKVVEQEFVSVSQMVHKNWLDSSLTKTKLKRVILSLTTRDIFLFKLVLYHSLLYRMFQLLFPNQQKIYSCGYKRKLYQFTILEFKIECWYVPSIIWKFNLV